MKPQQLLRTLALLLMALFTVACGAEDTTESIDATVNPALISRHTDSVTFELVGQGSEIDAEAATEGQISSVTLDGNELDVDTVEFIAPRAIRITVLPKEPMRSGIKELVVLVESNDGDFMLSGRIEVM